MIIMQNKITKTLHNNDDFSKQKQYINNSTKNVTTKCPNTCTIGMI